MEFHRLLSFLLLALCLNNNVKASEDEESEAKAEIEIIDLELVDDCQNVAEKTVTAIEKNSYEDKIDGEEVYGHSLKFYSDSMKKYSSVPYDLTRKWNVLRYPGDGLMSGEDYNTLIDFANKNEQLKRTSKLPCLNGTHGCTYTKQDYFDGLQNVRNASFLEEHWLRWQTLFESNKKEYPQVLQLVNKAAAANEKENARAYWEMLVDQEDAYAKAEEMWKEIEPLYKKLHYFVRTRLFRFYNISTNSTDIPVYLLGSNFGNDWSYLADFILPHPQLHYDADSFLKRKSMKDVYQIAELTLEDLKLGRSNWKTKYIKSCEPQIVTYCDDQKTELYTCNSPSWVNYLNAVETAIKIKIDSQDYKGYPRQRLRYSPLDEALVGLGSNFAIDLTTVDGIFRSYTGEESTSETLKMSKLLLLALRVLPRLPYYLAADKWRLEELEQNTNDINLNWWKQRQHLQHVKGVTGMEPDYLGDAYMASNKPYLSKFFGTILQFQILQYYRQSMLDPDGNVAEQLGNDENFKLLLKERDSKDWKELIDFYYGIYDLSCSSLLEYFLPLEDYLTNAPKKQKEITTTLSTTTSTTTMKPSTRSPVNESHHRKETSEGHKSAKKSDQVQNEQPKVGKIEDVSKPDVQTASTNSTATYIAAAVFGSAFIIIIAALLYRRYSRKKRTNNRRFEA